jgi:glucokinase
MAKETRDRLVVGIDLGGTKILAGVVDAKGKILSQAKRATKPDEGVNAVIDRMARTVRDAVKAADLQPGDIAAVCSCAPGTIDAENGVVRFAPNLANWENVPLAKLLSDSLSLPAFVENDVNLGTLGEHVLGAGQGVDNVIGIFVGTGIGGGLILNGQLWAGWRGGAGEVGHTVVLAEGPVCGCGSRGCVEALASRTAIERDIWAGIKAGRQSLIPDIMQRDQRQRLTSGALAEALEKGDPLVRDVIGRAQFYLGVLVGNLVNIIDPQMVIIGGGVAEALGEAYVQPIRPVAYQYSINKRGAGEVQIVSAKLGDHAALLGAAVHARQQLNSSAAA